MTRISEIESRVNHLLRLKIQVRSLVDEIQSKASNIQAKVCKLNNIIEQYESVSKNILKDFEYIKLNYKSIHGKEE